LKFVLDDGKAEDESDKSEQASIITEKIDHPFRKKVLVSAFVVNPRAALDDIDDISHGFAREIASRLQASNVAIVKQMPDLLSFSQDGKDAPLKLLRQLSNEFDCHYAVTGEILDSSFVDVSKYYGLWSIKWRHLNVKLRIYDLQSGLVLAEHLVSGRVAKELSIARDKDIIIGRDRAFGTTAFFESPFGKVHRSDD